MEIFWWTLLALATAVVVVWAIGRFVEGARAWRVEEFTSSAPPMSPDELDLRRAHGEVSEEEFQRERRGDPD